MQSTIKIAMFAALMLPTVTFAANEAPSANDARQAIELKLMAAKPAGFTERNVMLQNVVAEAPSGDAYPYWVTAIIRDYSPGFPANHFYGETCVGRIVPVGATPGWRFIVSRNSLGAWQADGRTTLQSSEGRRCTPNPSAGVSSMPLAGLH